VLSSILRTFHSALCTLYLLLALDGACYKAMKVVSVADLKNRLSEFLSFVEQGEQIEIRSGMCRSRESCRSRGSGRTRLSSAAARAPSGGLGSDRIDYPQRQLEHIRTASVALIATPSSMLPTAPLVVPKIRLSVSSAVPTSPEVGNLELVTPS
jgi:hypothetical protein